MNSQVSVVIMIGRWNIYIFKLLNDLKYIFHVCGDNLKNTWKSDNHQWSPQVWVTLSVGQNIWCQTVSDWKCKTYFNYQTMTLRQVLLISGIPSGNSVVINGSFDSSNHRRNQLISLSTFVVDSSRQIRTRSPIIKKSTRD